MSPSEGLPATATAPAGFEPIRRSVNSTEPLGYIPALDGLRGYSMIVVMFYHARFTFFPGGFLAVSIFFTLSGFLITSLLLREWGSERAIDMRAFWSRRFRRLLPAAWIALGGVVILGALGFWDGDQLSSLHGDIPFSLLQVVNWHFILQNHTYGGSFTAPTPVEHYWSLSVEEQFYLLIPLMILAVLRFSGHGSFRTRVKRVAIVLGVLMVASSILNGVLARNSIDRAYFGTDTRMAEMLAGGLLACATVWRLRFPEGMTKRILRFAGLIGLVGIVVLWRVGSLRVQWMYPWGLLLTAAATCAVIIGTLQGGVASHILAFKPIAQLGRMSYGTYLVHWPIFLILTPARTGLPAAPLFALRFVVSVAISTLIFFYIEEPIRRRRVLPGMTFVRTGAVFLPILLVGSLLVTSGAEPTSIIQRSPTGADAAQPGATRPPEVLLVGDQIAAVLARTLDSTTVDNGSEPSIEFAASDADDCGLVIGGWVALDAGGAEQDVNRCGEAVEMWATSIRQTHPDLVVVIPSARDAALRLPSESGEWEAPTVGDGSDYRSIEIGSTLDILIDAAGSVRASLVVTSVPLVKSDPPAEIPPRPTLPDEFEEAMRVGLDQHILESVPEPDTFPSTSARISTLNTIIESVAATRDIGFIDLADQLGVIMGEGVPLDLREGADAMEPEAVAGLSDWFASVARESAGSVPTAAPPPASLTDIVLPEAPAITPRLHVTDDEEVSILVVGDSIAYALGYGLVDWAENRKTDVSVAAWFGCPIARGGRYRMQRDSAPFAEDCEWTADYPRFIAEKRPDIVMLSSTMWQVVDRQLPGDTTYRHMGDEILDRYILSEFLSAVDALAAGGATVVLLTGSYVESGREKGFTGLPESEHERMDRLNEIFREVVRLRPEVTRLVELQPFLREQDGGELSPESKPDGIHFSDTMSRTIANWLGPQLESTARSAQP